MNRHELYQVIKELLCKYGAIPNSEVEFNGLVGDLMDVVEELE